MAETDDNHQQMVDDLDLENDGSKPEQKEQDESGPDDTGPSTSETCKNNKATTQTPPKDTLKQIEDIGVVKSQIKVDMLIVKSILAGFLVAGGCQGFVSVGGGIVGASLFSTGLYAVVFTGADLFTSDSFFLLTCILSKKVSVLRVLRNWTITWMFNYVGVLIWVAVLTYASNTLHDVGQVDFTIEIAEKKSLQPWGALFAQGIGANFFVCLAIFQSASAQYASGKILAVYFPVVCFALSGYQHSIANMYFITAGMLEGANVTVVRLLFQALLPATLGNIVGGGLFLGALLWYCYDDSAEKMRMQSVLLNK